MNTMELCIEVATEEESYVPLMIKSIMEDVRDKVPYVPIVADVEMTETSWANKKEVYYD